VLRRSPWNRRDGLATPSAVAALARQQVIGVLCEFGADLIVAAVGAVFAGVQGMLITACCGLAVAVVAWLIITRDLAACYAAKSALEPNN